MPVLFGVADPWVLGRLQYIFTMASSINRKLLHGDHYFKQCKLS